MFPNSNCLFVFALIRIKIIFQEVLEEGSEGLVGEGTKLVNRPKVWESCFIFTIYNIYSCPT